MPLSTGDQLAHYEILSLLGKGGMGEVYRARDTKLKREVAIKVLPEGFARDPERMARFQREAEVLASLNHPNIAAIHAVEDRALVIELVEGRSPKGPLPFNEAWKIASQIAAALEYAHERGIIHRDLKPANIMITTEGVVKLLDFGLAKAFSGTPDSTVSDPSNSPTLTMDATATGVILGTAAYMSPEQARGRNVDRRADIWAFGVVLYELLTGKKLFEGEVLADTLAKVVRDEPDLGAVPEKARPLVAACLEKDPKKRLRDVGDAWRLVEGWVVAAAPVRPRFNWGWVAAGILGVVAAPLALVHFREAQPPAVEAQRLTLDLPEAGVRPGFLALSPDGRRLVVKMTVQGNNALWVRSMDSDGFRPLEETGGARMPFWSPDSRFIGFFGDGKLKVMPAAGGPATTLCDGAGLGDGGAWSSDGVILFAGQDAKLRRVSASGGACTVANIGDLSYGIDPAFLPDGNHFLFNGIKGRDMSSEGVYLGSLDGMEPRRILNDTSSALYFRPVSEKAPAHILFLRGTDLMAQPFDAAKFEAVGDPFVVAAQATLSNMAPQVEASVASDGTLVYLTGVVRESQLTWFDRSGKEIEKVGEPGVADAPLSPDGSRAAVERQGIWLLDAARNSETRLTENGGAPVWSPDGMAIVYSAAAGLVLRAVDGSEETTLIPRDGNRLSASDWSRDGRFLIYTEVDPKTRGDIWYLPEPGRPDSKPVKFLATEVMESEGQLSPDGHWLAYCVDEARGPAGRSVNVRAFPSGDRLVKIADWACEPRWNRSGNELFYVGRAKQGNQLPLMAVSFQAKASGAPSVGTPQKLFDLDIRQIVPEANEFSYSPHLDGKRFLVNVVAQESRPEIRVITNWERQIPGGRK